MSTRAYNRVILVVNASKNLLLLFPLLFIKCNNFYMHIPSGNQLMLRRLMCLNKGLSIYLSIYLSGDVKASAQSTAVDDEPVGRSFTFSLSIYSISTHEYHKQNKNILIFALWLFLYTVHRSCWLSDS